MKSYSFWRQSTFWLAVFLLALPVALFYPYRWWVFDYAQYTIVTPNITDREHREVHLDVWFLLTYVPFAVASGLLGMALFVWSILKDQSADQTRHIGCCSWFRSMVANDRKRSR